MDVRICARRKFKELSGLVGKAERGLEEAIANSEFRMITVIGEVSIILQRSLIRQNAV